MAKHSCSEQFWEVRRQTPNFVFSCVYIYYKYSRRAWIQKLLIQVLSLITGMRASQLHLWSRQHHSLCLCLPAASINIQRGSQRLASIQL